MGVKDLWQLLSPIGRRVSIETLEGKTLAIDASIWITQFIKAMRDEEGKMMKNAHLIGTIRRVLKLLFHRIRPLFVFDGATPALKLRTVQARRKGHEKQEESKRVAAQRLLRARLKEYAVRQSKATSSTVGEEAETQSTFVTSFKRSAGKAEASTSSSVSVSLNVAKVDNVGEVEDDVEWMDGYEHLKGKNLDANGHDPREDGGEGEDEMQWQLPEDCGDLSAEALAALPPHLRKSLIEEARRRQRMQSRAHYLPVAGNPALYSQTQLSNFLNSSKLNRKFIDAHQSTQSVLVGTSIAAEGKKKYQFIARSSLVQGDHTSASSLSFTGASASVAAASSSSVHASDKDRSSSSSSSSSQQHATSLFGMGSPSDAFVAVKEGTEKKNTIADAEDVGKVEQDQEEESEGYWEPPGMFDDAEDDADAKNDASDEIGATAGTNNDSFFSSTTATFSSTRIQSTSSPSFEMSLYSMKGDEEDKEAEEQEQEQEEDRDLARAIAASLLEAATATSNKEEVRVGISTEVKKAVPLSQTGEMEYGLEGAGKVSEEEEKEKEEEVAWESGSNSSEGSNSCNNGNNDNGCTGDSDQDAEDVDDYGDCGNNDDSSGHPHRREWYDKTGSRTDESFINMDSKVEGMEDEDVSITNKKIVAESEMIALRHDTVHSQFLRNPPAESCIHLSQNRSINYYKNSDEDRDDSNSNNSINNSRKVNFNDNNSNNGHNSKGVVFSEVLDRAVTTASSMADWAGRAVRNALKEHARSTQPLQQQQHVILSQVQSSLALRGSVTPAAAQAANGVLSTQNTSSLPPPVIAALKGEESHTKSLTVEEPPPVNSPAAVYEFPDMSAEQSAAETKDARRRFNAAMRDTETLTEEMRGEVIELLQALNLPYLVAPYEAEAQCAVLEQLGLVDGVVTEDSDALLFGANTVYKNIFNDKKYVEVYLAEDARREMGLHREDLVALAYFLGSDYCEGVAGVGIVNAVEIIHAFPMHSKATKEAETEGAGDSRGQPNSTVGSGSVDAVGAAVSGPLSGLRRFKDWLHGFDLEQELRLSAKSSDNKSNAVDEHLIAFTEKHKSGRGRWTVPGSFPDPLVARAYLHPQAERSPESFAWTVPDARSIRAFCSERLGWTEQQMDMTIDPVLRRYAERSNQPRIDAHFLTYHGDTRFAKIASDRLREAVVQITGKRTNLALGGSATTSTGLSKRAKAKKKA